MHVHVHRARIDLEEEHVRRLALAVQQLRVRFAHRMGEKPVAHEAAVDEKVLPALGLRRSRSSGETQRTALAFYRNTLCIKPFPE
jgi:hypothetical protein